MPLQHLVEYFNDRLEQEHYSSQRPFLLSEGKVSGLFGNIQIDSLFAPIRHMTNSNVVVGHMSQATVTVQKSRQLKGKKTVALSTRNPLVTRDFESIINYDRLSRTVHMLNYLPMSHLHGALFLEVDPRHIMGIKEDHGAYFEEVIAQCGLETRDIVIVLVVDNQYAFYYPDLVSGLDNYRRRGYQIALKFDYQVLQRQALDLITKIAPNYVSFAARNMKDQLLDDILLEKLFEFRGRVASVGGQSILQKADERNFDLLFRYAGFDLVEGGYYRSIEHSYLDNLKMGHIALNASEF